MSIVCRAGPILYGPEQFQSRASVPSASEASCFKNKLIRLLLVKVFTLDPY